MNRFIFQDGLARSKEVLVPTPHSFIERLRLLALHYLFPAAARLSLDQLISLIDEPNQSNCRRFLDENLDSLRMARGSSHNHQNWLGGYLDHVSDAMNIGRALFFLLVIIGRPLPFTLSDVLLVLFLHDAEKPWTYDAHLDGSYTISERFKTKSAQHAFREELFNRYDFVLTAAQQNALKYIEGEMNDYRSDKRIMNELAAVCHACDVLSARLFYRYPRPLSDEWRMK